MGKLENRIIVDTDILINLLRKEPKTIEWFSHHKEGFSLSTTVINIFELYSGAYKSTDSNKKIKDVKDIVDRFNVVIFNTKSAKKAGKIRVDLEKREEMIDMRDIFIGAIAITKNIPIKTNNVKHFSRIEGLRILN